MKKAALRSLLSALVEDCGYEAVRKALEDCAPARANAPVLMNASVKRPRKPRPKPNAVAVVESLALPDEEKKNALMALAKKYEEKRFMPNVNSVRAFLEKAGEDISRVKSRQQVVSKVFRRLADWETDKLRELDVRSLYGPKKSLSVIARAIEAAGRRRRQESGDGDRAERLEAASSR